MTAVLYTPSYKDAISLVGGRRDPKMGEGHEHKKEDEA
jgi:hypothetical protein